MKDVKISSLPVCENERLIGLITDRDITVRGVVMPTGLLEIRPLLLSLLFYFFHFYLRFLVLYVIILLYTTFSRW
jgi:hypothetical protein